MSLSSLDIKDYKTFAQRLADAARRQTLPRFRQNAAVFNKAGPWFDPVTDADREGERVQRDMIEGLYPDHGIVGEEFGVTKGAGAFRWVLDPVDGTRAFVCGIATWTTLIALEYQEKPVLGLIDQPFTDECWLADTEQTTYIHADKSSPAKTSGVTSLDKARISTTDPRPSAYFSESEALAFEKVASRSRLVRFSMDAYAYGLLALGELDAVIETGLLHHDYASLAPVVEGAGGVITNWRGDPLGTDGRGETVAVATPELHAEILSVLNEAG